jgi:hypothetical protein
MNGAHDRYTVFAARANERRERVAKFLGLHIIGKAPKTSVSPAGIRRILAGTPQAAQRLQMHVLEMPGFQAAGQGAVVELRIMARPRDRTDVDEPFDAIGLQQRQKGFDRQRRMPEREDHVLQPTRFLRRRMFAHGAAVVSKPVV